MAQTFTSIIPTGILQQAYCAAVQIGNIEWRCAFCSTATSDAGEPVAEITRSSVSVNSVCTIYDPPYVMFGDLGQLQEESVFGEYPFGK